MLVSILLATYNRPEAAALCVKRFIETTPNHRVEIVVVTDDNVTGQAVVDMAMTLDCDAAHVVTVIENKERIGAIAAWNMALKHSHGDILVPVGDDQNPHPGWLDAALKCHETELKGYGCVGLNDLMYGQDGTTPVLMTTLLFDRKFCKEAFGGVVAIPAYRYLFVDTELNARAQIKGRLFWCRDAVVEHLHPAAGKREIDAIDKEKMESDMWVVDEAMFMARRFAGFPDNFEAVI